MAFASLERPGGLPVDGSIAAEGESLDFRLIFNDVTSVSASYNYSFSIVGGSADLSDFNGTGGSGTFNFSSSAPARLDVVSFSMTALLDTILEGTENLFLNVNLIGIEFLDGTSSQSFELFIQDLPTNTPPQGVVTIEGQAFTGNILTVDPSDLSDEDGVGEFSYQWFRNNIPILGATDFSYAVQPEDIGSSLSASVSYTDLGGTDEAVTSGPVAVVLKPATGGNDLIIGSPLEDTLVGEAGDDTLIGNQGNDVLAGGIGDDSIDGGEGNDRISGSDGSDLINGGAGNDQIGGGFGNDTIDGGEGDDIIGAGVGDDSVDAGNGSDVVAGGAGDDTLSGGDGNDRISGSFGNDLIFGGEGDDNIGGGTGQDSIDAGVGDDRVGGGEGDDSIFGGDGNDFLAGGGRNDTIDGGAGNDTINGGSGNDVMTGGAGADQFVFSAFFDGEIDLITDFEDGIDRFFIRIIDPDTAVENINNGGNGLAGFVAAMNIIDTAAGARMSVNGNIIVVEGIVAADLTVDDFQFL